jgi:hypothetical protein
MIGISTKLDTLTTMKLQSLLLPLAIGGSAMLLSLPVTQLALASTKTTNTQPAATIDTETIDFGSRPDKPLLPGGPIALGIGPSVIAIGFTVPVGNDNFNIDLSRNQPGIAPFTVESTSGVVGSIRKGFTNVGVLDFPAGDYQKLLTVKSGDKVIKKFLLKVKIFKSPTQEDIDRLKCQMNTTAPPPECQGGSGGSQINQTRP